MYYVYLLKSQVSDKVYLSYTSDLERRILVKNLMDLL